MLMKKGPQKLFTLFPDLGMHVIDPDKLPVMRDESCVVAKIMPLERFIVSSYSYLFSVASKSCQRIPQNNCLQVQYLFIPQWIII